VIRRTAVGAVAVIVGLAIAAGSAGASELTVAQAIVSQDKAFDSSPGYKLLENFKVKTVQQARSAIPKLRHTEKLLATAAKVVSRTPATTPAETAGRKDWVAGAHMVGAGIGELAVGLEDLVKGHKAEAEKVLKKSIATDKRGGALAAKGDKLLGLPRTD
jgi:hypothetical protein